MRPFIAALAAQMFLAAPAQAQEWVLLRAPQITQALADVRLHYENGAWQEFRSSGATLYFARGESWGYWRTQGDKYCSQWPPRVEWACYELHQSGPSFRFVDDLGNSTTGRVAQ